MDIPEPPKYAGLADRYTNPKSVENPLLSTKPPHPKNDQEAVALIQKSMSAIQANGGLQSLTPAMKAHVRAIIDSLQEYDEKAHSPVSEKIMTAINADPNLAPYR